jgi:hypothetical protein
MDGEGLADQNHGIRREDGRPIRKSTFGGTRRKVGTRERKRRKAPKRAAFYPLKLRQQTPYLHGTRI